MQRPIERDTPTDAAQSYPESGEKEACYSMDDLREMIAFRAGADHVPVKMRTVTDTTDFFRVDYGDVLMLEGRPFFIRNYEREGRFTIDEQPKFWVRRAIDLVDGRAKIIKMVFHERFMARVGDIVFECVRSPAKEARILDIMRGHPNFMQGRACRDEGGNVIRVIDYIRGRKFADHVLELGEEHREYFSLHFPTVLGEFIELVRAIRVLHEKGEKHGDIRRDHIIREKSTGRNVWIDFDFNYHHRENMFGYDLFGLGNVLGFLIGRGEVTVQELRKKDSPALERLRDDDMNIIFPNRVVNLKKVYPYIPDSLNLIMLRYSAGAEVFYDDTLQLLDDLQEARERL